MNPLRFTRRNLLRGSLAATAAVPLLEASRASAATPPAPTRFVVFATPNGTRNAMFWPTGTETSFTLKGLVADLEPWKAKLTFLKGIKLNNSLQNGALGGTLGSEHARGTGGMLTARPLKSGTQFKSFGNTTSGWGSGQSLDQYLVGRLAPPTTFKSLQVGVHVRDTEVRARISYAAADQPLPPREDPKDVFSALFGAATGGGGAGGAGGTATDPALARLWAQRKSIFDLTNAETTRLKNLVGTQDRLKLDAHLTAMRDVEQRLVQMPGATGGGTGTISGTCTRPTSVADVDLKSDDLYLKAGQIQMDLAAAALACDQTRILTFQWSYAESEHLFGFLGGITGNHHAISHDFGSSGAGYDAYNKIQSWYAQQLAYFLGKLDAYKEGNRSLLDNCVILWATEIGESSQHDLTLMPYVLAGSAGGKIRAGRFIDYGTAKKDNNQMLVSIGQAMGATDLTSFGDPAGATGPLPNLA
jgi:hypothetical protein